MTRLYSSTIVVRINTGPPTWLLPRFSMTHPRIRFTEVRFGWLRACVQVGFGIAERTNQGEVNE